MITERLDQFSTWIFNVILSVPVRVKIAGIVLLPVLILGFSLNYWITTGLSDWLSYILTDVRVEAAMNAGSRSVTLVTVLAAAASLILASFLSFILTRPLLALRQMALQVTEGQLDTRVPVWSNDEIGDVAVAINTMTSRLVSSQEDLARTNRRLTAINQVILAADRQAEIHDVLYAILKNTVEVMGLNAGWVYLRDPERDQFHLASWHNVPLEWQDDLLNKFEGGLCSCQEYMVQDILENGIRPRNCHRLATSHYSNHQPTHITLPIEARGQKYGVLNLLCEEDKTLDSDELEILSAIGAQISEIVANAWLRIKLNEKELARQVLLESLVEAQEEERGRLARELHDGAGQMLTSLLVRIKTLEKKTTAPDVRAGLGTVLEAVSTTIEQVRELSHRLRPPALEEFGLPVALETLVTDMASEAGLNATCHLELSRESLHPGIEVMLYRIAQEGLTNIVRHAQARHVEVNLGQTGNVILMRLEDDGRGFSPQQLAAEPNARHLGLISMHERASLVGGTLDVYSAPGKGTRIDVRIPIMENITHE